ncbi:MAG: TonB-dependent receptor [Proteobacteria bacterium]|nr:TonB-dependent receptor [Pseudomonadota bacterium]
MVTARQRSERLVDVPVTVEAFTAQEIRAAGIERPQDFVALTPGVSFVHTAEAGDLQISIRGLNTGRDTETNFAFVVDGVLQTNPYALSQELTNLTQIQVVKGPQGAIYGRNAVAGAIIIDTKKPTDTFVADVGLSAANHQAYKANAWVAGPITDGVAAGLNAYYTKTNGFYANSFLGCDNCVDFYKEYGATPRVIVKAGENGTLDFKAKYSKISSGAINFNASFALPAFAAFNPDFFQNVNDHTFDYINNIRPQNEQENKQVSVKGDWKLDFATLTAWAAYNDQTNFFLTDGTSAAFGLYAATPWCQADINNQVGAPLPSPTFYAGAGSILPPYSPSRCDGYQYQQRDQKDATVELRLTSPGDQRLRWLGGLYYADIKRHVVVSQGSDQGLGFLTQAFVPTSGPNPTDLLYDDDFHSKVAAVFGQLAYDIVPDLEGALALRYDSERRSVDNNVPKVNPQTPGFGAFGIPDCPAGPGNNCTAYINPYYNLPENAAATSIPGRSDTFSQVEPKVSLNWKFMPDWATYASWGVGFRSGGFNSSGSAATVDIFYGGLHYVNPDGSVSATPSLSNVNDEYKKEVSRAAEVGIKGELLDHRLYLSADYYYTKVDDMQIFNFFAGPFGLLRVVTNLDRVTLQGVEGEVRWRANNYVNLFAGIGTVDSKIDSYAGRPYTAGNKVPYAPAYTGSAGVDFTVPFGNGGISLVGRLDASAVGKTWFSPVQNNSVQTLFGAPGDYSKTSRDAFTLLNARLGISSESWDVIAWSRNLTDKRYLAEVIPAPEFGGSFIHQGLGRAIGVDIDYRFNGK